MRPHVLRLDFAARTSRWRLFGIAALVLALAVSAWLVHRYVSQSANLATWEAQWRKAQKAARVRAEPAPLPKAEWERLQGELRAANRVVARLNLAWDALFREIEASVFEQITLLSVEPDTERREVKLTAEAKDFTAMLEYEKRLQATPLFQNPYITSHQIQQQDPQRPVRFVVVSAWPDSGKAPEAGKDGWPRLDD